MFADDLQGRWKINGDNEQINITIKKYEKDNSLYKIIFYKNGNASVYVENNKIETWTDGTNKKYRILANSNSFNRDFGKSIEINYAVTKSRTDILAVNANNKNYILTRIQSRKSTSSNSQKNLNKVNNQKETLETNSNHITSNENQQPKETVLPNIKAKFGNKAKGNWRYIFLPDGTFSEHIYTTDGYGNLINDYGIKNGTYRIVDFNKNNKKVYLRYENGAEKEGLLSYGSRSVEFHINGKVIKEYN